MISINELYKMPGPSSPLSLLASSNTSSPKEITDSLVLESALRPSSPLSLIASSDPLTPNENTPTSVFESAPILPSSRPRKLRVDDRLDEILALIKSVDWSVAEFLRALERRKDEVSYREDRGYSAAFASFGKYAYKDLPKRRTARAVLGLHPNPAIKEWGFAIVGQELRAEIKSLVKHAVFSSWTPPRHMILWDNLSYASNHAQECMPPGWS